MIRRSVIRGLAEKLSRGVVLRRRLPAGFGRLPFYVTPEASLRYWLTMAQVDPMLYDMAAELIQPGSIVWDIGANVGLFSFSAAALAGPSGFVLAVEPDFWLAHLLSRSSRRLMAEKYACADVKVLCGSISDSNRISELQIAERERASNYLLEAAGSTQTGGSRHAQSTVCLTLDSLLDHFPAPSILKIDTEAHEAAVLRGATRLLTRARPKIWCEVSPQNSQEITELLHAAGYELYGAQAKPHPRIDQAWFHTLAVPSRAG